MKAAFVDIAEDFAAYARDYVVPQAATGLKKSWRINLVTQVQIQVWELPEL
jgi:hypothetical protein